MLRSPWELFQEMAHYQHNRDNALIVTYQSSAMFSEIKTEKVWDNNLDQDVAPNNGELFCRPARQISALYTRARFGKQ